MRRARHPRPEQYRGAIGLLAMAVDRAVSVLSPERGARRLRARAELAAYDAASKHRTRRQHRAGSADSDLLDDLPTMRRNSRALVRDDGNAAALVRVLEENVIGTGIRPQMMCRAEDTGLSDAEVDRWNAAVEQVWADWEGEESDAGERMTFSAMQRLALREFVVDGEALLHRTFVRPEWAGWRTVGTAFESIDVDRLVDPVPGQADRQVRSGVEIGDRGQPVAYWITPRHPDDSWRFQGGRAGKNDAERFRRFQNGLPSVLHVYRMDRTGQTRGVPFLAPCLGLVEHLNDMIDTEAVASRAASKFVAFIRQTLDANGFGGAIEQQADGEWTEALKSGTMRYLGPGEEMQSFSPNRPGTTWEPFVVRMLRSICAANGLPYEMVLRDFRGMNYSNARVALLEARRGMESLQQQIIVPQLCRPVLRCVLVDALLTGRLTAPRGFSENPKPFLRVLWQPPAWGWVDPVKEIEASALAVENNLSSPQAEAARQGVDVEDVIELRGRYTRRAMEAEKRYGLPAGSLLPPRSGASAAPAPAAASSSQEDADADDGRLGRRDGMGV